jgi:inosine/xanthosine triphosphatase
MPHKTDKVVIVVASSNPVKIQAALSAFQKMFPEQTFAVESVSVSSGVSDQPMSSAETLQGARNRIKASKKLRPEADFWVGMEGGVEPTGDELMAFAWMVVESSNLEGKSCTGCFFLPPEVVRLIRSGKEMGEADDIVFNMNDSKRNQGAAGILTHNVIDRMQLYEHAMVLALIPFRNKTLYQELSRKDLFE